MTCLRSIIGLGYWLSVKVSQPNNNPKGVFDLSVLSSFSAEFHWGAVGDAMRQ